MAALWNIIIIAFSLAPDCFSVSAAGGLKVQKATLKDALKVALFFGGFQLLMPLLGWAIGASLRDIIMDISNWVAFILLSIVGLKMIKEALDNDEDEFEKKNILNTKTLTLLAIATSIDALVIGVTLNFIDVPLIISVSIIGFVTFVFSLLGFLFGKKLGSLFDNKLEIIAGIVLILLGVKMLFE